MNPLITTDELSDRLREVALRDIRWALTDPNHGRATYEAGHIPGAVFVDLDTDLSAPPGPGRHPLPSPDDFAASLGRLGIGPDDEVVVYDDAGNTISTRLWWMLRSIGHEKVRVLDGGYQAWVGEDRVVETGDVAPEPVFYPVRPFTGVAAHTDLAGRPHVDARAADRYRGDIEPVDPKAGHIPGAINLPVGGNLDPDKKLLSASALRDRFESLGDDVVVSCGSGVNACHNALAMVVAGLPMPDVYVGSYSEWSRLGFDVTTGSEP